MVSFRCPVFLKKKKHEKNVGVGFVKSVLEFIFFLKALNISPERVGFYQNDMLSLKKKNLYVIFNGENDLSSYGGSGLGKDEQLLAFYLAYKNGVKGELIDLFKKII